jgi:hypothetical protein
MMCAPCSRRSAARHSPREDLYLRAAGIITELTEKIVLKSLIPLDRGILITQGTRGDLLCVDNRKTKQGSSEHVPA